MSEVSIKWLEGQRFVGVDSTRHGIVLSTTGEEGGIGAKPSDLLLLALGGCSAVDVVSILQKKRQSLTDLAVYVSGEQESEPPWTFRNFHVHYVVTGRELAEKAVDDAIRLSQEKYCSVAATLRLGVPVTSDYEIVDEEVEVGQMEVMSLE